MARVLCSLVGSKTGVRRALLSQKGYVLDFIDELVPLSGFSPYSLATPEDSETGYLRKDLTASPADPTMRSLCTIIGFRIGVLQVRWTSSS
jgi:hypothetical protein